MKSRRGSKLEMYYLVFCIILQLVPVFSLLHPVVNTNNDEIIKELAANVSQLRQDLDAFVIREQVINRTVHTQEKIFTAREQEMIKTIKFQQQRLQEQETKMTSLQQYVNNISSLCNYSTKVVSIDNHILMLGQRLNQSLGAHDVVLIDIINKMREQKSQSDARLSNITGQIRHLTSSILDVNKQLDHSNGTNNNNSADLLYLQNQVSMVNQSLKALVLDLQSKIHIANQSAQQMVMKAESDLKDLQNVLHHSIQSFQGIRGQLEVLNTTEQQLQKKTESELLTLHNQLLIANQSSQGVFNDIAFTASLTRSGPLGYQTIIYDKIIANIGNAYNSKTGVFTCPRNGVYVFTWSAMSGYDSQDCTAYISYNGARLLEAHSIERNHGQGEVASNTAVLPLTVGDRVWIQTTKCEYYAGYPYTGFSG